MLWLALRFPQLPIEALHWPLPEAPRALTHAGRVVATDALARQAGVQSGHSLASALGLAPQIQIQAHQPEATAAALQHLACWAGSFTPDVYLDSPAGLLLEIGACLRLWGHREGLLTALTASITQLGYAMHWAVATTPLAASWLASQGKPVWLSQPEATCAALQALPFSVTGWPDSVLARLAALGLTKLGELSALPCAGLRQRLGGEIVESWLRAQGLSPDIRQRFAFPARFDMRLTLPAPVMEAGAIIFVARRLFASLAGWLKQQHKQIHHCLIQLHLESKETLPLPVRFGKAGGDMEADAMQATRLLSLQLERVPLTARVDTIQLLAEELVDPVEQNAVLFEPNGHSGGGEGVGPCLARLRARLGDGAVQIPHCQPDYRPEMATHLMDAISPPVLKRKVTAGSEFPSGRLHPLLPLRPLWLLPTPKLLPTDQERPRWQGCLQLLSRAERIESGWWDEGERDSRGQTQPGDVRRDYFVAANPGGQWLWIFRDASGWYLHGFFA